MASPKSTITSAFSPMRRAHSAPAAVAKRKPDTRKTKYEGNATPKRLNRSGCTAVRVGRRFARQSGGLVRRSARHWLPAFAGEHVDGHEAHPHANGDIGDVERGPVAVDPLVQNVRVDE